MLFNGVACSVRGKGWALGESVKEILDIESGFGFK